jgi:hypothetical protein
VPTPAAEMQYAATMQNTIQATIGMYDASVGNAGKDQSGKAILAQQSESDTGTYDFADSLKNAQRRIGILLIELIPKIYDTERILRIKNPDGSGDFVEINKTVVDEQTGKEVVINDLAMGKYDVIVTTGASYATKRTETADSMLRFAQAIPQVAEVAPDLIAENMDFANSDAIAERLKKTLPPQILSKEEQEDLAEDTPEPQPDPNLVIQQQMQQMDMQIKQMEVEREKLKTEQEQLDTQQQAIKLEEEKVKLQQAEVSFQQDRETNRKNTRDDVVSNIVSQMKGSKSKTT